MCCEKQHLWFIASNRNIFSFYKFQILNLKQIELKHPSVQYVLHLKFENIQFRMNLMN